MKERSCRLHNQHKDYCKVCNIVSYRAEIHVAAAIAAVSIARFCYLQTQISEICGLLGGRDAQCLVNNGMPSYWSLINPAYLYIWNIEHLKTNTAENVSMYLTSGSMLVDFVLFAVLMTVGAVVASYVFSKFKDHMKLDGIKTEFKEKELRMRLTAEFDDKAKAIQSRHKQLTAPSADPSIWERDNETVYTAEPV